MNRGSVVRWIAMSKTQSLETWLEEKKCRITDGSNNDFTSQFLELMRSLGLDGTKKQRPRAEIPVYLRCQAFKANGDQCTRRRKSGCELCGTHLKGTPHGRVNVQACDKVRTKRYLTCVKEVNGINYHVDINSQVVYLTDDILGGNRTPRAIGRYIDRIGVGSIEFSCGPGT